MMFENSNRNPKTVHDAKWSCSVWLKSHNLQSPESSSVKRDPTPDGYWGPRGMPYRLQAYSRRGCVALCSCVSR